ncbi:class I adenylate-forming enzyme family protein [Marinibaculum pumilum]|uniref:Class I adenylate-forming enzyme family protein n=1 Tax=Marinibaculum pumilum TaxID=1766165 RepID=A0ABV7L2M3_9PROT
MVAATDRPPATYRPLTIASGIIAAAERTPDKIALQEGERRLAYRQLAARIHQVGQAAIADPGLRPGDRAALVAGNCLEYAEIVAGLSAAGIAVATVNPRQTAAEIAYIIADCGARLVIADGPRAELLADLDLPSVEKRLVIGPELDAWRDRAAARDPGIDVQEWDAFAIPYTSGTTGKPKGVVLSHRSRVTTFFAMAAEYGCYGPDERYLALAPLFHGAGFAFAHAALYFGGFCEVLPAYEPVLVLRRLGENGLGGTFMVPTHFHAMFALEPKLLERYRGLDLKAIVSNAAPLPQATKERIVDYFGPGLLHETYGSTEGGIVTNLRPADQLRKVQCVGQAFPMTRIRLLDDDGAGVADGEVGELFSNGPTLFNGYFGMPEETEAAFRDGWFSAGDMARMDEEGFFYLVDRKKDMIISGGVNIYPREIEEVLFRCPGLRDVAVIGRPDDYWGEAVAAIVVADPDAPADAAAILDFSAQHLAPHKRPKSVAFIDVLPRNAAGKVLKRDLRAAPPAPG